MTVLSWPLMFLISAFLDKFENGKIEELKDNVKYKVEKMDYEECPPPGSPSSPSLVPQLPRRVPREDTLYARVIGAFRRLVVESTMTHNLY